MIQECTEIRENKTVGEEFINWAEEYWLLDKIVKIEDPDTFAGEKCEYNYMRGIFIEKINSLIKNRF